MKLHSVVYCLLVSLLFFLGCDRLEAPYKRKQSPITRAESGQYNRTDAKMPEAKQYVLVEDFTGFRCGNCPVAGDIAEALAKDPQIVAMKVHIGPLATPDPLSKLYKDHDFRTPIGNEIDSRFTISSGGIPRGMVNRVPVNGNRVMSKDDWGTAANALKAQSPPALIAIDPLYNPQSRLMDIQVQVRYLEEGSTKDRLVVYITEDSVAGPQTDYRDRAKPDKANYSHDKMLRGSLLDAAWGHQVLDFLPANVQTDVTASGIIPAGTRAYFWYPQSPLATVINPKHASLVGVLFNDESQEVKQVFKQKLMPE
jgi:hypothetical protein